MSASDAPVTPRLRVAPTADGSALVVKFADPFLNYATCETLGTDLKALCGARAAQGVRLFAAYLSDVAVMDSCGLSMLVAMKKAAEAAGARIRLFGLSPMIRRLFVVTKVERVFDICDDERAALA